METTSMNAHNKILVPRDWVLRTSRYFTNSSLGGLGGSNLVKGVLDVQDLGMDAVLVVNENARRNLGSRRRCQNLQRTRSCFGIRIEEIFLKHKGLQHALHYPYRQ